MRVTALFKKRSVVPTRDVVPASSLVYNPRYSIPRKMTLSSTFDTVNDTNRFLSLEILLKRFSGHVGRRQYRMMNDLSRYSDAFKELGVDWHDLKYLGREELQELFAQKMQLSHAEKAVLLTALDARLCGVLRQSTTRHSTNVCMHRGRREHGWRCGMHGHTNDVYFEGKQKANPAVLNLAHRSSLRVAEHNGVMADVRSQPDFSIVGRFQENINPRVWNTPENPNFVVSTIGYEFRVHPDDPRAVHQIENAAAEWELHAAVTQQIIWEMVELHAVSRDPQPFEMAPGEMGAPDSPQTYSSAFTTKMDAGAAGQDGVVVVEQRMMGTDGEERPWFRAPLRQPFRDGVPEMLPFAPTIIIRSSFRQVERLSSSEDLTKKIMQPVMDIECFVHPLACFWWNAETEERCVKQIVDYAKRIPFALPFNLYFRIDTTKAFRADPTLDLEKKRLAAEKAEWFDLRRFRTVHRGSPQDDQ